MHENMGQLAASRDQASRHFFSWSSERQSGAAAGMMMTMTIDNYYLQYRSRDSEEVLILHLCYYLLPTASSGWIIC